MQTKQLINQGYIECKPAYGRDYQNKLAAKEAFLSGQDFLGDFSVGFQLLSCRDFAPGTKVNIRYNKGLNICTVIV